MRLKIATIALLIAATVPGLASANLVSFTDRVAWTAAVAAAGLAQHNENFDTFADADLGGQMQDFTVGPASFQTNDLGFTAPNGFVSGGRLVGFRDSSFFRSDVVSGGVRAVGFDWANPTTDGFLAFAQISVNASSVPIAFPPFQTSGFLGFILDAPEEVSSVTMLVDIGDSTKRQFTDAYVDNMSVGVVPSTPVVEPTTLAILGLGLAGIGLTRRRKA